MSVTRAEIRREAAARLGGLPFGTDVLTATAGTTTTATIRELDDSVESDYRYQGAWLIALNGTNLGAVRRIQSYIPSSGTVSWERAMSAAVANNDTFEVHTLLDPTMWNECINRALRRSLRVRQEQVTAVANQLNYALASHTWLTRPEQVMRLRRRDGTTANQYTWTVLPRHLWDADSDDDVLTLNLTQSLSTASSVAYFFDALGPYAELSSDSATSTIPLDWAAAGAVAMAYELYSNILSQFDRGALRIDKEQARLDWTRETRKHAPTVNPMVTVEWS